MQMIPLAQLHPHPRNPRLDPREDVIEQIAAQINGHLDEAHALIVRPNASGYEIISGHHRALAAQRAGLAEVPCWVREMGDDEAYMALALNNAQGELHPLEVGLHALGSGLTVREYAARLGIHEETLRKRVIAAQVVHGTVDDWAGSFHGTPEAQMEALNRLSGEWGQDHWYHLAEIHAAPEWLRTPLVADLMREDRSTDKMRVLVKRIGKAPKPPEWAYYEEIAVRLIEGTMKPAEVAQFQATLDTSEKTLTDGLLEAEALILEMKGELERAFPARLSEVQEICRRFINRQADLIREAEEAKIAAQREEEEATERARRWRRSVSLEEWGELDDATRGSLLGISADADETTPSFNRQKNADIEWAQWSWNPITGCLHDCPYCYARDIALALLRDQGEKGPYPNGFAPTLRPLHLLTPQGNKPPKQAETDTRYRNVFTCSMADLFGRWVPAEWIKAVLAQVRAAPQWNFLFLTKFPNRMASFDIPENAWMGTSVDLQARVPAVEKAFAKVKAPVRWLSIEPMLEPIRFTKIDLFDWIVVGGASKSTKTPEWRPPYAWLSDLDSQVRASGRDPRDVIYLKTNALGNGVREGRMGMPAGMPAVAEQAELPEVFRYLGKSRDANAAPEEAQ